MGGEHDSSQNLPNYFKHAKAGVYPDERSTCFLMGEEGRRTLRLALNVANRDVKPDKASGRPYLCKPQLEIAGAYLPSVTIISTPTSLFQDFINRTILALIGREAAIPPSDLAHEKSFIDRVGEKVPLGIFFKVDEESKGLKRRHHEIEDIGGDDAQQEPPLKRQAFERLAKEAIAEVWSAEHAFEQDGHAKLYAALQSDKPVLIEQFYATLPSTGFVHLRLETIETPSAVLEDRSIMAHAKRFPPTADELYTDLGEWVEASWASLFDALPQSTKEGMYN